MLDLKSGCCTRKKKLFRLLLEKKRNEFRGVSYNLTILTFHHVCISAAFWRARWFVYIFAINREKTLTNQTMFAIEHINFSMNILNNKKKNSSLCRQNVLHKYEKFVITSFVIPGSVRRHRYVVYLRSHSAETSNIPYVYTQFVFLL